MKVIDCLLGNKANKYDPAVRTFTITMQSYHTRCYEYVRSKFNNNLPHVSTLRAWYANAQTGGTTGITKDALNYLSQLAAEMQENGKKLLVSLCFDEMSIRKHVQWSDSMKKFLGFVDIGQNNKSGELKIASNALVFMVNGLNQEFSLPIAYYFITHLKAEEKADLLLEIITAITKTGIQLTNVTFDGLSSNIKMCNLLGASFKLNNFRNFIINPVDKSKIFIMLDACHMLKLIRNCLGAVNIYDNENRKISWHYIESLEKFRTKRNFVTHKLTKKHVQWRKNKMNVRLAVQSLSNRIANSIKYLRENGVSTFQNSEATETFIRMIDKLFDVFNSNSINEENIYKNSLNHESMDTVFSFCSEAARYLLSLKFEGKKLCETKKKLDSRGLF